MCPVALSQRVQSSETIVLAAPSSCEVDGVLAMPPSALSPSRLTLEMEQSGFGIEVLLIADVLYSGSGMALVDEVAASAGLMSARAISGSPVFRLFRSFHQVHNLLHSRSSITYMTKPMKYPRKIEPKLRSSSSGSGRSGPLKSDRFEASP